MGRLPSIVAVLIVAVTAGWAYTFDGGLTLAWGESCAQADADYADYEGTLGSFASHLPIACSPGGALGWMLAPQTVRACGR